MKHHLLIDQKSFEVAFEGEMSTINGSPFLGSVVKTGTRNYHIVAGNRSFEVEIMAHVPEFGEIVIRLNAKILRLKVSGLREQMLERLGIDTGKAALMADLKAPMPGLVLKVFAKEGMEMKKGEPLLTLEAMKMENLIKLSADATIRSVRVKEGDKVEKDQLLILF